MQGARQGAECAVRRARLRRKNFRGGDSSRVSSAAGFGPPPPLWDRNRPGRQRGRARPGRPPEAPRVRSAGVPRACGRCFGVLPLATHPLSNSPFPYRLSRLCLSACSPPFASGHAKGTSPEGNVPLQACSVFALVSEENPQHEIQRQRFQQPVTHLISSPSKASISAMDAGIQRARETAGSQQTMAASKQRSPTQHKRIIKGVILSAEDKLRSN